MEKIMHICSCFFTVLIFLILSTPCDSFGNEKNISKPEDSIANVTRAVILLKKCKPTEYPVQSIKRGEEGNVHVKILIDTSGIVKDSLVIKSSGFKRLDDETIRYFSECKYSPATENSIPISVWQTFEYTWRIQPGRNPPAWKP